LYNSLKCPNFIKTVFMKTKLSKKEQLICESILTKALMDILPELIYFKDKESRFFRCSRSLANRFNIPEPEEVKGKTDFDFYSESHARAAFDDEKLILEKGITISKEEIETWNDRPDSWLFTTKAPLYDLKGKIIGTFGISRDITEKKRTEDLLVDSEERFRAIVRNMGEGMGIVDENETFEFSNPAAEEIFGVEQGKLVGRNLKEFFKGEQFEIILNQTTIRKKGEKSIYEIAITRPSGEQRLILVTSSPRFDNNGNFSGTYGVFRDITERKEKELIIERQNAELKNINSQKDKLLSIIAHDLRSPFDSFIGLTEILESQAGQITQEDVRILANEIRNSASRIYNLLSNLLEWSRVQRGLIKFQPQEFLLIDVIQQCTEVLQEMAKEKQIEVRVFIPDDLEVFADPYMMMIIVQNLLSNAIKFTCNGGLVTVSGEKNSDNLLLTIGDSGIGMSEKMLENIFEIDSHNNRQGTNGEPSSGLGLILCKEFIDMHSGKIWVKSEVDIGSTFFITLPFGS
jgi:PAS domain S-box-containing protein